MEPVVHVKISDIVRYWNHPALSSFRQDASRRKCCQVLLPDLFNPEKCPSNTAFNHFSANNGLDASVLRMVVNGNRKSLSGLVQYLGCADFAQKLIDMLNINSPFSVTKPKTDPADKPQAERITPRNSLFRNILELVSTSHPGITADSPLFSQICLEPDVPNGRGAQAYQHLRGAVYQLLLQNSPQAYAYAIMLYVLAGWLQWRIEELPWLWNWDLIPEYLAHDISYTPAGSASSHVPFNDPSYMYQYHAYLYRSTSAQLFEAGQVTFTPDTQFGSKITLQLRYQSGDDLTHQHQRLFQGTPVLSRQDSLIYANMKDESGSIAHLYIPYKHFNANMYFRTALLLTCDPQNPTPLSQKLVLTHRALTAWEIPYAQGIVSGHGDLIIFTPAMLEIFLEKFRDEDHYPWLPFFRSRVLPMLQSQISEHHTFHCELIHSHFVEDLPSEQILQITLALKSIPIPGFAHQDHFQTCLNPPDTHLLFR